MFDKFFKYVVNAVPREHVVERLVRPVGLEKAPTGSTVYSKGNTLRDMFDSEKTEKRVQELGVEFNKSGMYDMYTFRKTGGKLFYSPASIWQPSKALYFPHIRAKSLVNGSTVQNVEDVMRGKINVVRIFTSTVGDNLSQQYLKADKNIIDNYQVLHLNMVENLMKSFIVKLSMSRLRRIVPENTHSRFFVGDRNQLPFTIRETLQIGNVYTGYIFVVDPNLKIRWMACGGATNDEVKELWASVNKVSKEFQL